MNKRFYRSSSDKMIGGVAGGVAEYFNVDPVLIRVAFVVLALSVGFGFLAYIILWIIVPYDYQIGIRRDYSEPVNNSPDDSFSQNNSNMDQKTSVANSTQNKTARNIIAIVLIVLGIFLLLDNLITEFTFENLGPILLILIGALILIFAKKNK